MIQKKKREDYEWEDIIEMYKKSIKIDRETINRQKGLIARYKKQIKQMQRAMEDAGTRLLELQEEVDMNCKNTEM